MANMTLSELEPYILGKKFLGKVKVPERVDVQVLEDFLTFLEEDPVSKELFNSTEVHSDFYKQAYDANHIVPKNLQKEIFYAAKIGKVYQGVPSYCVYMLKKAWELCDGIPNLIMLVLPLGAIKEFLQEDYFGSGINLCTVIRNVCTTEYNPVSDAHPKNKLNKFGEIYVSSTNMIAAVPLGLFDVITDNNCSKIILGQYGLELDGVPIRSLANYVGAVASTYDLRELV